MSYLSVLSDGPITSPSQVDEILVPQVVTPTRVSCAELAPDSPFRAAGQVCAPTFNIVDMFSGLMSKIGGALAPSSSATTATPADGVPMELLIGGAAVAVYLLMKKSKRT
jgi:hypothetical protein